MSDSDTDAPSQVLSVTLQGVTYINGLPVGHPHDRRLDVNVSVATGFDRPVTIDRQGDRVVVEIAFNESDMTHVVHCTSVRFETDHPSSNE